MAMYQCELCGYVYDEETDGVLFQDLAQDWVCPLCRAPKEKFHPAEGETKSQQPKPASANPLAYPKEFARADCSLEPHMADIHTMSQTGATIIEPMGTKIALPSWDDILILVAQLNPAPLNDGEPVNTTTIIGKADQTNGAGKSGVCFPYVFWSALQRNENRLGKG